MKPCPVNTDFHTDKYVVLFIEEGKINYTQWSFHTCIMEDLGQSKSIADSKLWEMVFQWFVCFTLISGTDHQNKPNTLASHK